MVELSEGPWERLKKLFPSEQQREVATILEEECGNNLPFLDNADKYQLERVRFAALKLSDGNIDKLLDAVILAQTDWRDLFMSAGFGESVTAHEEWLVS